MILTYEQIAQLDLPTRIVQRLGVDAQGRPLALDGQVGPLTRAGRYLSPMGPHVAGVRAAMAELLAGAEEVGGNNRGPWVAKYYGRPDEPDRNHGPWCAAFAGWCLQADLGPDAPYSWSARRLLAACAERIDEPELGAVPCWERASAGPYNGHVGIIAHIEDDGAIWVIEGNANAPRGAVRVYRWAPPYTRAVDRLIGFGRPLAWGEA